jgi:hypothetical protein
MARGIHCRPNIDYIMCVLPLTLSVNSTPPPTQQRLYSQLPKLSGYCPHFYVGGQYGLSSVPYNIALKRTGQPFPRG